MNESAAWARASGFACIESRKEGGKVLDDAPQLNLNAVEQPAAAEAVPLKAIEFPNSAMRFDDESDRAFDRPLRGMSDVWRQQKDFAFANAHVVVCAVVDHL